MEKDRQKRLLHFKVLYCIPTPTDFIIINV
jgi:hypothetical protein